MVRFIAGTSTLLASISVSFCCCDRKLTKAIKMRGRFISPYTSSSQSVTEGSWGRSQDCSLAWQTPGPGSRQARSMSWPEPMGCASWSMCVWQNWRGGLLKLPRAQKINSKFKMLNINLHVLNLHCLTLILFMPWFFFWNIEAYVIFYMLYFTGVHS